MRDRCPEDGHHGVSDELLDRPSVALDLLPQARVVGADASADVLRIRGFGRSCEADEVTEENADDFALLLNGRARLDQRCSTETAELEAVGVLLTARGADSHGPSLGARTAEFTPRPFGSRFSPKR